MKHIFNNSRPHPSPLPQERVAVEHSWKNHVTCKRDILYPEPPTSFSPGEKVAEGRMRGFPFGVEEPS
jgi:hypothetical protein